MWSLGVYTRKKQAVGRLNLTPKPGLGAPAKAEEAPSRPGRKLFAHRLKRNGKTRGLRRIAEKSERSGQGGGNSGPPSTELRVTGEKSLRENSTSEETQDEKIALLSESVTDDLQTDSSSSSSKQVTGSMLELERGAEESEVTPDCHTGLSLQHDISGSLLSYSFTDPSTEYKSSEENLSSFPSPELFRGSDYLEWECPMLEENMPCRNSTLLDISKAVAIEKVPEFSNLSAILDTSSEDYQKCHRKVMTMLADQSISPKPKAEADNASCGVLLAEKNYLSTPGEKKEKLEKDPEPRDTNFQTTLSCRHLKIKVSSSHQSSVVESSAGESVAKVLLPQSLKPALNTHSSTSDKKSRGLLTSTPSSQTPGLVIDLSSVQKTSFEELFPNVSNYVNSNEIVPVSTLQDSSSNEVPSNASEICYIIKASPGTRQVESKGIIVKKKYSLPKDIPQDIIIKTSRRM